MGRVCQILNDLEKTGISVSVEAAKGAILEAKFTGFIITSPKLARDYRNRETFSPFPVLRVWFSGQPGFIHPPARPNTHHAGQ